ncbi:MAG: GNAT family N-acetyltransferase [Candidatus Bathyarchaeia archaeon]
MQFGVPSHQRGTVAHILFEALGDKLQFVFGDKNKAELLMSTCLCADRFFVAYIDGKAVGVAGLEYDGKNYIEIDKRAVAILGLESFRLMFWEFMRFFDRLAPDEIHVQALAVLGEARSKGVGRSLLKTVIAKAKLNSYSHVRLEVIDTNVRAKKLYEKVGFKQSKISKIPYPFSKLTGFSSIIEMRYNL